MDREVLEDYILLSYRWAGETPEPGQFIVARAAEPSDSASPFLNRPFFVHDYDDGVASLFFEVCGRGTALLAQAAGEIFVSVPLGRGFVLDDAGPVALVGGRAGASPLGLVSKRLTRRGVTHEVYLWVSDPRDAGRFRDLFPQANVVRTNERARDYGQTLGTIGDLGRYTAIYASGPGPLLGAVRDAAGGIPCQLAVQERMACANGSCYGCAVPVWRSGALTYARACVEGPVFPAEVLAW